MKGGLVMKWQLLVVLTDIVFGILTVLCFRVLSVFFFFLRGGEGVISVFLLLLFLVYEAYILMLAMLCPIKKPECLMKDLRSLQKWRRILVRNRLTFKCLRLGLCWARC